MGNVESRCPHLLLIETPGASSFSSAIFLCEIQICMTLCLSMNECIQNAHQCVDDQLRIHNLEVQSDKGRLSSAIGIYLPLPMHGTQLRVFVECYGGGGAFGS